MSSQALKLSTDISASTLDESNIFRKEWVSSILNLGVSTTLESTFCTDIVINGQDGSETKERFCCPHGQHVASGTGGLKCIGGPSNEECYLVKKEPVLTSGLNCRGDIMPYFHGKDDGACVWTPSPSNKTQNTKMGAKDPARDNRCPIYFPYNTTLPASSRNVSI